jgi:hypothetical protein
MNLTPSVTVACLAALFDLGLAHAGCETTAPEAVAKAFYSKHANFHFEDPIKIRSLITPRLFAALSKEYKCSKGEICAIEAVPWTNAQDGDVGNPVELQAIKSTATQSTVRMTYPYILSKTQQRQQHATLILERKSPSECWLFADLLPPRGESLVESIEKWFKEFGGGL